MATTWLAPSTSTINIAYTDSGGSTAYFVYQLRVGGIVNPNTGFQASSALTGAAGSIVTFTQTSTQLAWVTEQLNGQAVSTQNAQWISWMKESAATANMGSRAKMQSLSSNSTFIDNVATWVPGSEMSATGYTPSNLFTTMTNFTLTTGQRLGLIVQASSFGGTQNSGNVLNFAFGASGGIGQLSTGDGVVVISPGFTTVASTVPPSTLTFTPAPNSLALMGLGVEGIRSPGWHLPGIGSPPKWLSRNPIFTTAVNIHG